MRPKPPFPHPHCRNRDHEQLPFIFIDDREQFSGLLRKRPQALGIAVAAFQNGGWITVLLIVPYAHAPQRGCMRRAYDYGFG